MSPTTVRPRGSSREMHTLPGTVSLHSLCKSANDCGMTRLRADTCNCCRSSEECGSNLRRATNAPLRPTKCSLTRIEEETVDRAFPTACHGSGEQACCNCRCTFSEQDGFSRRNRKRAWSYDPDTCRKSRLNFSDDCTWSSGPKLRCGRIVRVPVLWWANCLRTSHTLQTVLILLVYIVCTTYGADPNQCAVGLKTPGKTWPQGDIVLEHGQPLRILCMLNKTFIETNFPGKNASDLVFFRNKKEMEPEYISIINETTIALYVEKPPPAEDMYYCKLRMNNGHNKQHEAVCLNKVVIGFKPREPQNFSCVSHNWENMICSWDPVQNYVTTRFTLVFKLPGRAGGRKLYPCPKENQRPLPPNTCLWDTSTNPIYRQPYEYYTFILNVENVLGNISVSYKIHHFAHVIPAKPANLSVVNKTSDSALLHWSIPFPMQNFPPGLHHRVTYQNQWDHQKTWQIINITNDIHMHKRYFNLTNLKYANTVYDVRVFMKSALAIGEDKWSQFSDVTFRTPPRLPGLPPKTDIGSFEITENSANRDVYVYWQAIPPYQENGDNFKYQIAHVEENGRKLLLFPNETTRTYAKFKGISFNSFRFEIVSTNVVGSNKERAKIFVPSQLEIPHEPVAFTKIAFEGGVYELSWKQPLGDTEITNYTIFWCDNERDRPYQCTGYLDWVHVSRNTTIYNMTVPDPKKVYQFAISANTKRASSGMVWASCTVIHNKVVGKMKSVWINRIGSDFIEVGWKLDCSDRIGIVEGFNIYYCPIVSPYNLNCKGPKLNTTIKADPHTIHGVVNGLKPYTTYMLAVAVLTKTGEGLHSDPLYNTTLEAAPTTPPQDVEVTNVTNSTMFVMWKPPEAMNGVLRYYEVYYNSYSQKVEETNHVELKDLVAHKNYSIRVSACTVSCSVKSPAIFKVTDIGTPGKINIPNVRFINSSQVVVLWNKPQNTAGHLDYYQISSSDGEIQNSTKTEAQLPIPDCKTVGRERLYQFRVRAVNVAPDSTHLKGPWSDPGEGNCYSDGPSFRVWIIIWVIGSFSGVAFLLCLAYTSKRMWLKCKAMQDVEVKLPPGLAPNMKLLQKVGEQHSRQLSADSSGCSSGQESVTSSLTSDSHVSTDSGADVDPVSVSPNKLLESTPTWESSSLRQRNVGTTRPGGTTDSARWDPYVKVAKTTETALGDTLSLARSTPNLTDSTGYTTSQQTWSSTGYISMPSSEELSSNPSPVPKDTTNVGGYSVVGRVPKPIRSKSEEDSELTSNVTSNLISIKPETKLANPYVSLASLEQRPKERKVLDSLQDLDDLAFVESSTKSTLDDLAPFSISDKISKPYVQTGLRKPFSTCAVVDPGKCGVLKASLASTSLTDSKGKPFVSTFSNQMGKLEPPTDFTSKPYVPVTSSSGLQDVQKPYVPVGTGSDSSTKPYVLATSVFQMLQQQREKSESSSDVEENEIEEVSPANYPFCWQHEEADQGGKPEEKPVGLSAKQTAGYITIADNPKLEPQGATNTTTSPYVQHQRFEKPIQQESAAPSDEQYSKVAVVPSTMK
ncbi:uncharacterized protein LOC105700688 [Orussus abietinus]|uniref:uncharacterized protein LOC105700688 n=1 Tax=Orussus abietinus TaxID=222816 RepID=UPI0006257358|nr:uncharacterized protein LOC105700688 [Orussus abietinus]XP_012282205.1 uncharacterized protein LOC105700688 [Orussus abietinus]XP_012282208.1 uncharacterized protein LOC105700688 [Orussus abietinus]XP_023287475.1 uncharacterized protein LOC105700688 [Orussus abietinus]XP_023287476.1 uncharacterized protein LOC105700688 [Orussus abietinus]